MNDTVEGVNTNWTNVLPPPAKKGPPMQQIQQDLANMRAENSALKSDIVELRGLVQSLIQANRGKKTKENEG